MNAEAKTITPLSRTQNSALRFIAGSTNQFYIRRAVNDATLQSLIKRGFVSQTDQRGIPSYAVTDAGRVRLAAEGPVA